MQLQQLCILSLVGLGAAATTTTSTIPTTTTTRTGSGTTICEDYIKPCGSPPTTSLFYGGCHDVTISTTYTAPPCPSPTTTTSCTKTGTICDDRKKTCGYPTPTTVIPYGVCHHACVTITYSEPPCPTKTSTSSCTRTESICVDYLKTCGSPTPTTVLPYGGCHGICESVTYTPPPCPKPTTTPCKGRSTSTRRY